MGEVYRARDTKLDRDVAVKVLPAAVGQDAERLTRFDREAKSLAALNHPNIAQIYAVEDDAIVMELVPGVPLHGPLPLDIALDYAKQIASALEAAHERGIIHRDLKPGNVMVTPEGVVKVLDFGLAGRAATDATESRDLSLSPTLTVQATQAGVILGTAAYMSPEQAAGKAVDKRTDIWAFGVIVWEMLTGRQMFEGETISHVLAAVLTKAPDLHAAPARVRPMLARCLEKDPKKRLRDIGDAMSLVQSGETTPAPARRPWLGVAAWGVAAVFAIALGAAIMMRPPADGDALAPLVRLQIERNIGNPFQTDFALSPDGSQLAYYVETTTGMQLRVRALATGESKDIPITTVVSPTIPVWSPDGTSVLIWIASGTYVVDVANGMSRLLCSDCRMRGGTWNREGVILLGSDRDRQGIKRLSLTDGTPRIVTNVDASRREKDSYPVFLPGGRRFLFTRFVENSPGGVYIGAIDGDEPRRIADGGRIVVALITIAARAWMVSLEGAGLMAQPFDLSTENPVGQSRVVVSGAAFASVSANGILATSGVGRSEE